MLWDHLETESMLCFSPYFSGFVWPTIQAASADPGVNEVCSTETLLCGPSPLSKFALAIRVIETLSTHTIERAQAKHSANQAQTEEKRKAKKKVEYEQRRSN